MGRPINITPPNIIAVNKSRKILQEMHEKLMRERWIYGIVRETWGERNKLEELGMDGRTILKSNFRKLVGDVDCIDLAQDRDRWNAVVKVVTKV
jgi:hypothetical protein